MPKNISKNLEILAENEAKLERGEITADELHQGMRPIIKSDTRADYDVHAKIDVSKAVIGLDSESVELAAAKGIEVPAPEPVQESVIEDTVAEPVDVTDSTVPVEDMANEPAEEPAVEPVSESVAEPASEPVAETAQQSEQPKPAESEYDVSHTKPISFAFDKAVEKTPEKTPESAKESVSKRNSLPDVSGILENDGNDGHGGLGE